MRQKRQISEALVKDISKYIINGFADDEIAVLVNLPVFTLKALRAGKDDSRVKKSTLMLKNAAIEKIKAGKGKISGLIWFLSRRYPKQFADPATQLTLSGGNTTNQTIIVTADVAERLTERSKSILSEIDTLIQDKNPETALE